MGLLQHLHHKIFVGSRTSGVYANVAEAKQHIPQGRKVGYNHDEAAELYTWLTESTKISDFAILFYFSQLLRPGMRVFDFGGNIGVLYYAFRRRWTLPENVIWTVCDVPAVVEAGRRYAAQHDSPGLSFTSRTSDAAGADVLLTSGTLQCVEDEFSVLLARIGEGRPEHLLINRVPMWDRPELVSLQDLGPVVYPYRIFNRSRFIASMREAGYEVRDQWRCPEKQISIRFRPWMRVNAFDGYYLTRRAAEARHPSPIDEADPAIGAPMMRAS